MRKGFSLIEMLIFMAIFTMIVVSILGILVVLISLQSSQEAAAQIEQQGQFVLQTMQIYIETARLVDMSPDSTTSTLALRESNLANDPTLVYARGGVIYVQQGSTTPQALTSVKVAVSGLSFTRHYNLNASSSVLGSDSVSFSFTMTASSTAKQAASQFFQSSAAIAGGIPKIVLVQKASAYQTGVATFTTITASYTTNNDLGDLLLAVVENQSSTPTVSISDTASNTWNKVAGIAYPAYNSEMNIFAALNSKSSSNTVQATLTGNSSSGLIYLYEYRGAATSSSFDTSTAALQPNTQTPSSGFITPTSSVELLFSAIYNANSVEVPVAANGFILESSSTNTLQFNVSVEDSTQFITGPVSSGWQYSATTPSSSVLIAAFK